MSGGLGADPLDPAAPQAADSPGGGRDFGIGRVSEAWPRVDDGLQIRGGGVVAVDTVTLREAAARFEASEGELADIGDSLGILRNMVLSTGAGASDAAASAAALSIQLNAAKSEALAIAAALREAALAYEIVELRAAQQAAVLAGDASLADSLSEALDALAEDHPDAWSAALMAEFDRTLAWPGELVRQSTQWGVSAGELFSGPGGIVVGAGTGLLTIGGAVVVGTAGAGRHWRHDRLSGQAGPVTVTPVPATAPNVSSSAPSLAKGSTVAPQSLVAVTERMPGAGDSRVRVERYTMPDGSRQYAVYVAGMQSAGIGGADPWDNTSNVQLYTGQMSDSYAATEAALAAAGAEPGDVVHAFGHSAGGMIVTHLALESPYDVQTAVTLGSPVDGDVGPGTLSVALRHTDDPVAALAGGGHGQSVGAPGSFVAERVYDPDAGLDDVQVPAHPVSAYAETAALVDASTDPRVDGLRDVFGGLAEAEGVTVTEYAATRGTG
ncbi:hypothetical protein R8Z57_15580 [Microbacterium sp. M3]|uniref:Alpha/beta hydrolase n=1 Tax=Microbacterium arthrosphaerae TaxID=792652 RepID=A0ABU4H4E2_9MICO|nr:MULTISPECIES: hypothetical protein [Microbacterium]MDW4574201.1 hypothetical protein [Microbacterium arthrosphaerae]MDW7608056.1 hypothetical protein [Microbacterium sp. M3]